ncbi:MAG: S41 family peptidase [Litorimonas sp.]
MQSFTARMLLGGAALPLLVACGGGGSSPAPAPPPTVVAPPPAPTQNTWVQGRFDPASQFKNLCEFPRSGSDAVGRDFLDESGTLSDELFWLRSWSDETYLWYDEITDQNPNNFSSTLSYFDELRTTRTTASGNPVDQFHFTVDSAEYLQLQTTGSSAGYGVEFVLIDTLPPRDIRVAYTEAGGPGDAAGFVRGSRLLRINGVDVVNGSDVNTLNAGLFPDGAGETFTFEVEQPDGTRETFTVQSAIVSENPVNDVAVLEQDGRTYGYVHFTTFSPATAEEALFDAFDQLEAANIDDLVLDLRYNGGGRLAIASQLAYMVAGPGPTSGRWFETLEFNDKAGGTNPVTGQPINPTPFYTEGLGLTVPPSRQAPTVSKPRVFVLTTDSTCSASEAVMNGLRGVDVEVIQIGGTTCGKPYGFYPTDNCGTTYFTIQFRGVNYKGFGDYADGFAPNQSPDGIETVIPGCSVADDFNTALGDPSEALLSTAITYAASGSCDGRAATASRYAAIPSTADPSSTAAQGSGTPVQSASTFFLADDAMDLMSDPRVRDRVMIESIRILD